LTTSFSTTRTEGRPRGLTTLRILLKKEYRSALRFYPILLALGTVNLCIAVGAPIIGTELATTVDVLAFMILMTTYTMMGFTVSSFAEDKQDGTLELLVTCPVTKLQILLGKLGLGLGLAVPLAIVPFGVSAYFFMGVTGAAVAGLVVASILAALTATCVALLMVVVVRRIEVGVYLGFMVAWLISFTPSYLLRVPVLRDVMPGYYIRQLFLSVGGDSLAAVGSNVLILAALCTTYLVLAAWILEREDAVLTAV
jgi:ABC-type transport system involved in multi-copper enzyme maturation permease subunit